MQRVVKIKQKQDPLEFLESNIMLLSFDLDFNIVSCNDSFEETTQVKLKEIKGKHVFLDVFKELPVYTIDDISYTIKQGKIWQGNLRMPFGSQTNNWFNTNIIPTRNNEGIIIGYSVMSSLGKSQADLISAGQTSENWLKAVFNDPEEANILIDTEGKVIEYNRAAFSFAEWYCGCHINVDDNIANYFPNSFYKTLKVLFRKAEAGIRQKFCREFKNTSGYQKIYDIEIRPVFSSDMKPMGFVLVIIDITSKVELSKRIKQSEQKLSDIAFINAHEVRAPLASMMGLMHLLDYESVDNNSKQILERLKKASSELEKIIHKVSESTYIEPINYDQKLA